MRYPVNNFKTEWNITAGYGFGAKTDYGYHEGVDINDNGAGNSDLGKEIFAIANGELVYWHGAKHPNTGFGYHSVYKITGAWGTRWVHQAHCMPDITQAPKAVTENERIARVGNSGTRDAHIHFAIFKVDPVTLRDGIDTIAKTQQELNDWWEDPIIFIEKWMRPQENNIYKGLDLTNKDSMKVAVDVWDRLKKGELIDVQKEKEFIQNLQDTIMKKERRIETLETFLDSVAQGIEKLRM